MKYNLDFYTGYNQFYLNDKNADHDEKLEDFWTAEAYHSRLAIGDGILGVETQSYGHVKAELHVLEKGSDSSNYEGYDHLVEGCLFLKSGILQVLDCPYLEPELEIVLPPGNYRVRVYSSNLNGIEMDEDEGDDYYRIEIWPDSIIERRVLKNYKKE